MDANKKQSKCPFFKMLRMCFPALNKKPTKEQNEVIELVNEVLDQAQDAVKQEFAPEVTQELTEVTETPEEQIA